MKRMQIIIHYQQFCLDELQNSQNGYYNKSMTDSQRILSFSLGLKGYREWVRMVMCYRMMKGYTVCITQKPHTWFLLHDQGCLYTPAENEICRLRKKVIADCIWVGDHSVKDNEWFLGYACTIIWHLNHIESPKWKVWNKFLTTLSISATITSSVHWNKILSWALVSLFSDKYCVHQFVNTKLGRPDWRQNILFQVSLWKMLTSSIKILAGRLFSQLQPGMIALGT